MKLLYYKDLWAELWELSRYLLTRDKLFQLGYSPISQSRDSNRNIMPIKGMRDRREVWALWLYGWQIHNVSRLRSKGVNGSLLNVRHDSFSVFKSGCLVKEEKDIIPSMKYKMMSLFRHRKLLVFEPKDLRLKIYQD